MVTRGTIRRRSTSYLCCENDWTWYGVPSEFFPPLQRPVYEQRSHGTLKWWVNISLLLLAWTAPVEREAVFWPAQCWPRRHTSRSRTAQYRTVTATGFTGHCESCYHRTKLFRSAFVSDFKQRTLVVWYPTCWVKLLVPSSRVKQSVLLEDGTRELLLPLISHILKLILSAVINRCFRPT